MLNNIKIFDKFCTLEECQSVFNALKTLEGIKDTKNYIGDVKWVLYQYICNMNTEGKDLISIRCGNFALSKLISMAGMNFRNNNADVASFNLNINGESLIVRHVPTLDKKQLILSCDHEFISKEQDEIIHPNDIILYYA